MSKRKAIDAFFKPAAPKKPNVSAPPSRTEECEPDERPPSDSRPTAHDTYPFPQPHLPPYILSGFASIPASDGVPINDKPDLDLLSFTPLIPRATADHLFAWLRRELFFYRVKYSIQRGPTRTEINTPRYTTVFGVDATASFSSNGVLVDARTQTPVPASRYATCRPRPLPPALDALRTYVEACTDQTFNFCLANYYAHGADSISWHSDDERFLGPEPAIASLSLGARRDFCMKQKPPARSRGTAVDAAEKGKGAQDETLKWAMGCGDMLLMRGRTQGSWLHSVPKRKGGEADRGRINITFRKAFVPEGTENYYRYNVGNGGDWRWDEGKGEMVLWGG